ncbi:hypothetical protein ACMA5I_08265 [Paracoccaceae bacterium GXU_MW_L88]
MKTIYLHIGHYKTGSTAIQAYCHEHADALREVGYLYPSSARPNNSPTTHGHLALTLGRDHGFIPPAWYGAKIPTDEPYAQILREIEAAPEQNIIISSEEFVQLAMRRDPEAAVADLKARLSGYDVKIVFYFREPLSLLKSWYNQVNKGSRPTRNFPTFFMNVVQSFLGQRGIYHHFAQIFGRQNMILRPYGAVGTAHISGFLEAVGCSHRPSADLPLVNEAQDLAKLEIIRLNKERPADLTYDRLTITEFEDPEPFLQRIERVNRGYGELMKIAGQPASSALSAPAILDHYAALLLPASAEVPLNPKEADRLRSLAAQSAAKGPLIAGAFNDVADVIDSAVTADEAKSQLP